MGIFSSNDGQQLEAAKNRFKQQMFQQNMSLFMQSLYDHSFECFSSFEKFGDKEKDCLQNKSVEFVSSFEKVANVVNKKLT